MKLFPAPGSKAARWGLIYLLCNLFILPAALVEVNGLLGKPLEPAALNFLFFCINFIAVFLIFRRFIGANLQIAVLSMPKVLLYTAAGLALYWLSTWLMSILILWIKPNFANVNDASIALMTQQSFPLMAFGTVVLVPFAEELLYRGLVFRWLYGKSPVLGWCVSIPMFCIAHVMGYVGEYDFLTLFLCFLQYVPAGLILAWAYCKSGTVITSILMHMVINFVGILTLR